MGQGATRDLNLATFPRQPAPHRQPEKDTERSNLFFRSSRGRKSGWGWALLACMICTASSAVAGRSPTSVAELTSALSEKMQRASGELLPVCRYRKGTQSKGREAMKASSPDTTPSNRRGALLRPAPQQSVAGTAWRQQHLWYTRAARPPRCRQSLQTARARVIMTSHSQHSNLQVRYGYQVATYHNSSTVPGAGPGPGTGTGTFEGWTHTGLSLRRMVQHCFHAVLIDDE